MEQIPDMSGVYFSRFQEVLTQANQNEEALRAEFLETLRPPEDA